MPRSAVSAYANLHFHDNKIAKGNQMQSIFSDTRLMLTLVGIAVAIGWMIYMLFSAIGQGPKVEEPTTPEQGDVAGRYHRDIQGQRAQMQNLYDTELVGLSATDVHMLMLRKSLGIVDFGILADVAEKSGASHDVVVAINKACSDFYGALEKVDA